MGVGDVTPVEVERDPPLRDMEGEFAKGAIVIFPAAVFLFEIAVAKLFDGLAQRRLVGSEFVASRLGLIEGHGRCREFHGRNGTWTLGR